MRYRTLVFDLDNTLYSAESGLFDRVDARIQQFLIERLGMAPPRAAAFRARAVRCFGTTLRGLRLYYPAVDPMEFLDYCHDLPLHEYLAPDPDLRDLLKSFPQRKVIFTNSDRGHTRRVLELLGVADLFADWITIEVMGFIPKPLWEAYAVLVGKIGHPPSRAVYVDDLLKNLVPARRWGFQTVWIRRRPGSTPPGGGGGPVCIASIAELHRALAWMA